MRILIALLLCAAAWGNTCTSLSAGNLDVAARWSNCGGTYPQDGDSIIVNHAIIQNVPGRILGGSTAPVYGYVDSVTASPAGSGYVSCAGGAFTGGTSINSHSAQTECGVVNGQAVLYLKYKGIYTSLSGLALGAITATNATIINAQTVKGATTRLGITSTSAWAVGSTQNITIAGTTGAWSGINGTWNATVTSTNTAVTYFTIPYDSSALSGTPAGTITAAPGVAASYTFATVAGGGTAAATISNSSTASLTFAANTRLRGDLTYDGQSGVNTNNLIFNPGVTVTVDSTQAAGTPMYRILGTNATSDARNFYAHCAGNPCRLEAQGNVTAIEGARWGPRVDIDSMQFYRVGDASSPAIYSEILNAGGAAATFLLVNSTFDTCGRIMLGSLAPAGDSVFHYDNNVHKSSPVGTVSWRTFNLTASFTVDRTTGNWTIRGNAFDLGIGYTGTASNFVPNDIVIEDNYFGGGGTSFSSYRATSFARNYWQIRLNSNPPGDVTETYVHLDVDLAQNPHWIVPTDTLGVLLRNSVFGFSGTNNDDSGEVLGGSNNAVTFAADSSIFLCDASGVGSSEIMSVTGSWPLSIWRIEHNTFCGGKSNFGAVQVNETGNTTAGSITFRSNIVWSADPSSYWKMDNIGSPGTTNICTASGTGSCDYNAGYNLSATNKAYQYTFTSPAPGAHDVDGQNPNFVDRTRRLENWDRKYLGPKGLITAGQASPSAWSAGTYALGDLVSHAHASLYGGETFNFRCRIASCTAEPGVPGTAWRDQWEWAAQYHLRNLMPGTQIDDADFGCSGCYPVQAVIQWVKAGFKPQNAAYQNAAHDGTWIGAMAGQISNDVADQTFSFWW